MTPTLTKSYEALNRNPNRAPMFDLLTKAAQAAHDSEHAGPGMKGLRHRDALWLAKRALGMKG